MKLKLRQSRVSLKEESKEISEGKRRKEED
jgi:hypothetical protein